MSSANAFDLDQSKKLLFGKDLSGRISFHFNETNGYKRACYSCKSFRLEGIMQFPNAKCQLFYVVGTVKMIRALTVYHTIPTFNDPKVEPFENIVGKGENAGNQHFLLFPQCLYPFKTKFIFSAELSLLSANAFNLDQSKKLSFGEELSRPVNWGFDAHKPLYTLFDALKISNKGSV